MDHAEIIDNLSRNALMFRSLLEGLGREQYEWRQTPEKWCLLEIVNHLYDEEREDFRARLKDTLESPELPLAPIDPVGWVTQRQYMQQDFNAKLIEFLSEREQSVKWLRTLASAPWGNVHHHPNYGDFSAEMFLHNWLAHDYLHFRQIVRLRYDYLKSRSQARMDYAGDW